MIDITNFVYFVMMRYFVRDNLKWISEKLSDLRSGQMMLIIWAEQNDAERDLVQICFLLKSAGNSG